jgi:hypothetical protein
LYGDGELACPIGSGSGGCRSNPIDISDAT